MVNYGISESGVQGYKLTVIVLMSIFRLGVGKIWNILQLQVVSIQLVADTIIDFKNEHDVHGSRLLSLYKITNNRNP